MGAIGFGNPYTDKRLPSLYFNAPPPPQTLQAPKRTLGQLVNDKVSGALTPVAGKRMARKLADLVDYSPVGAVAQSFDAGADIRKGNYIQGAVNALLNVIPDGGGKLGGAVAHSIIAPLWHGSPHKFEKFALEKIGTGEGAQAYGHGLYFAENPEVARDYQRQLAGMSVAGRDPKGAEAYAAQAVDQYGSPQAALQAHLDYVKKNNWQAPEETAVLHQWAQQGAPKIETGGHLYQVKLDANPEDFLDWDKSFSEQPLSIFEKVRSTSPSDLSYKQLTGSPEASDKLRRAGIPGIRYLDQGSRGAGNGTRNYVVFDPSIIDITNRY